MTPCVVFQVSQPYNSTDLTFERAAYLQVIVGKQRQKERLAL